MEMHVADSFDNVKANVVPSRETYGRNYGLKEFATGLSNSIMPLPFFYSSIEGIPGES